MLREVPRSPRYSAPALEKGLDILELLAGQSNGLTQKQIAAELGRSASEIFRMLRCLEQRGYVRCKKPEDLYYLTLRLFELAHRQAPTKRLLAVALPVMQELAASSGQSCHLAVLHECKILVVCTVESLNPLGFSVRLGAQFPLQTTSSGLVLMAFQPPEALARLLEGPPMGSPRPARRRTFTKQLQSIRARGFEQHASRTYAGITDLSCPVLDHNGAAIAALTIPCLVERGKTSRLKEVLAKLQSAAGKISDGLGGGASLGEFKGQG